MCGIVAFLSASNGPAPQAAWLQSMADVIKHRGPDDDGVWIHDRVGLSFRRLAILDLSPAGHQPMVSTDGQSAMVFNGEIYNYVELRRDLASRGHTFRSSGDSEVLLNAYREWGMEFVDRLVGMFAFCIVDLQRRRLVLARDRFGIKPLYYHASDAGVLFASEIKALRRSGLWHGDLNTARFARWLAFGRTESVPEDQDTFLEGIHQVPAGHLCEVPFDGPMRMQPFWTPSLIEKSGSPDDLDTLLEHFEDSMRLHMRADVPVGVMLSGGMDSVSIACEMARIRAVTAPDQPLHAFCYLSDDFDESQQLSDTIQQTGCAVHTLRDDGARTFWSRLDQVIWHHDEPVHSPSVLMGYELYRAASANGIRVVLSGQGADETLGGYHYLFDHLLVSAALEGRLPTVLTQARAVASVSARPVREVLARTIQLLRAHVLSASPVFRRVAAERRLREAPGRQFLTPEFSARALPAPELFRGESLSAALVRAIKRTPLPQYLRVEDRNSMAHSVEARVPFLDHRLAELALALPAMAKLSDGWNKRVLRDAMRGRIPDSVRLRQEKLGFPTSARRWFATELADDLREVTTNGRVMQMGWFDSTAVHRALERHIRGEFDATNLLFNI
ncbi:MAG: asparagine synthase (glutamine-hydrolyzing), partial [Gemmatimonas sp.]